MRVKELLTMALAETTACNYAFQQFLLLLRLTFSSIEDFWSINSFCGFVIILLRKSTILWNLCVMMFTSNLNSIIASKYSTSKFIIVFCFKKRLHATCYSYLSWKKFPVVIFTCMKTFLNENEHSFCFNVTLVVLFPCN